MYFSHILYKVKDVKQAVKDFEDMGFTVTPGAYNSHIWFDDESFIELFEFREKKFMLFIMKLFGMRGAVNKMEYYKNADYGFVEFSLENDRDDLDEENALLKQMGYKFNSFTMKKKNVNGLKLKWKITFPRDAKFPFLVAPASTKAHNMPKGVVHKNGAKEIEKITWGFNEKRRRDVSRLTDDKRLEFVDGDGFVSIKITGFEGDVFTKKYYK